MLETKFKESMKFKAQGRCDLLRMRLCDENICIVKHKTGLKDYFDEIFSGLIWLA